MQSDPYGKKRQEDVTSSPCQSITQLGYVLTLDTWKFKTSFATRCQLNVHIYSFRVNGYGGDFPGDRKIKDYTAHINVEMCKCGSCAEPDLFLS